MSELSTEVKKETPATETELKKFLTWAEHESVLAEHVAEHTFDDLKQAFVSGIMLVKDHLHQKKQQATGTALSNLIAPPPTPETTNTSAAEKTTVAKA